MYHNRVVTLGGGSLEHLVQLSVPDKAEMPDGDT
jgi:hypothetical protein